MRTEGLGREQLLERIADFHGHLGPYALLGFRAGQLALRELGAKGYFDLEADVHCGDRPPLSCFADGVQLGSGCTAGKGNLRFAAGPSGRPEAAVTFRLRAPTGAGGSGAGGSAAPAAGRTPGHADLVVRVRPETEARGARWLAEVGDVEAARRLLDLADEEVFVVEHRPPEAAGSAADSSAGGR